MHDLDIRLERLAAEATCHAVPPEPETITRRGRRRRRGQLAGTALVVAAAVGLGLALPARLAGRGGPDPEQLPATAPAIDVAGAGRVGGYWFGRTDASVFLTDQITPAQRRAIVKRIKGSEVADTVYIETRKEAYERLKAQLRNKPGAAAAIDKAALLDSFRVRLDDPEHFARLQRALCGRASARPKGAAPCMAGVKKVIQDTVPLKTLLVPKPLATSTDVTVFLPNGDDRAAVRAVQARLEAIDGVTRVAYRTPEEAYRGLPKKLRRDGRDPAKAAPLFSPDTVPAAFHVTLDRPANVGEFHRALCGSRRTGDCGGGLVVLTHPRR